MRRKNEQPRYRLYQSSTDSLVQMIRSVMRLNKSEISERQALQLYFKKEPSEIEASTAFVMAEERHWQASGRHVIFPLPELIKQLADSKFNIRGVAGFSWPFQTSMIALPTKGILGSVPGVLITWQKFSVRCNETINPFYEHLDRHERMLPPGNPARENAESVTFSYQAPHPEGVLTVRAEFLVENIPYLLGAETAHEFGQRIGRLEEGKTSLPMEREDIETQYKLLRLVAGMSLLYQINPKGLFQPGLPGVRFSGSEKLPRGATAVRATLPGNGLEMKGAKALHHRRWHFRTLVNERYYQGEHKDAPRGSRVVLVSDSLVGAGQAHTSEPRALRNSSANQREFAR